MNDIAGLRDYPLARRGFAMTSLIAGFTMATTRVEAQQITTDTTGIEAGDTKIPVPGGDLPAYFARPAKGANFPIVLVFEEIFGVHEHIKDVCRRLAKAGYLAVATEYYARIGDLSKMTDIKEIIANVISKEPDAQYMEDADATVAWAAANKGNAQKVAVTGFWVGILRLRLTRRYADGAVSPYRGWMAWHHIAGLIGGAVGIWLFAGAAFAINCLG